MSRAATNRRGARTSPTARKPFWEMDSQELKQDTAEFDQEFVDETFGEPTPDQQKQLDRAKRKRGRPRVGQGVEVVSVSIEKGLLRAVDDLAKRRKVKRAELISQGLRAILEGRVPVTTR